MDFTPGPAEYKEVAEIRPNCIFTTNTFKVDPIPTGGNKGVPPK